MHESCFSRSFRTGIVIERLSSKHRARLRAEAHHFSPVVHVGKEGVTPPAVHALTEALNSRELVKIRVLEAAPLSAREAAGAFVDQLEGVHLVHVMGRTIVLYRPAEEKVERK